MPEGPIGTGRLVGQPLGTGQAGETKGHPKAPPTGL